MKERTIVYLAFIAFLILMGISVGLAIREDREWQRFKEIHHCRPVEHVVGGMNVMIPKDDKTCYACDDGQRYWR